jgi:hypothetical protein
MRYRRENKKMLERLKTDPVTGNPIPEIAASSDPHTTASRIVDHALLTDSTSANDLSKTDPSTNATKRKRSTERSSPSSSDDHHHDSATQHTAAAAAAAATSDLTADQVAVDAAVAAAESYGRATMETERSSPVQNPLEAAAAQAALDAAAQLAAVSTGLDEEHV